MKTITDPRHERRARIVKQLFAISFEPGQIVDPDTRVVWENIDKLDPLITQNAPEWPLDKLNKVDLAILRLAIYELTIEKKEPIKVIIDEAVELAKGLGSENSASFVNGVLGTIVKEQNIEQ